MSDQRDIVKEIIYKGQEIEKNDVLFQQRLLFLLKNVNKKEHIIEVKEDSNHIQGKREHYENQEILSCLVGYPLYLKEYKANMLLTQSSVKEVCENILASLNIPTEEIFVNGDPKVEIPSFTTMKDFVNYINIQFPELEFKNTCNQITRGHIVKLQEDEILTKFGYYEFKEKIEKDKKIFENQKTPDGLPGFLLDYKEYILKQYDDIICDYKKKIEEYLENAGYYKNASEYILQSQ